MEVFYHKSGRNYDDTAGTAYTQTRPDVASCKYTPHMVPKFRGNPAKPVRERRGRQATIRNTNPLRPPLGNQTASRAAAPSNGETTGISLAAERIA
jgi:hypothetical protein